MEIFLLANVLATFSLELFSEFWCLLSKLRPEKRIKELIPIFKCGKEEKNKINKESENRYQEIERKERITVSLEFYRTVSQWNCGFVSPSVVGLWPTSGIRIRSQRPRTIPEIPCLVKDRVPVLGGRGQC